MATTSDVLGLLAQGKRSYHLETKEVKREEFEAQVLVHQLVFGELGLADTLGPTWAMIHDPRFIQIENSFVHFRQGRLGGDASTGQSKEMPDGSFHTSVEDLNQYSELLGEGRYLHSVLRSMAYHEAAIALWPKRHYMEEITDPLPGLAIFNGLRVDEQERVAKLAATYTDYRPGKLFTQTDDVIWNLIGRECPNYRNPRTGKFNPVANQLFAMLRLDLVGLVDDYCEVARLQEWVLLDDEHTLVEQQHLDMEAPRVWAEVEMLERALTLRASLRSTAAQILDAIGATRLFHAMEVTLTDQERDELLQIVYSSSYPDNQPDLINDVMAYLSEIRASGNTTAQRELDQCALASKNAKYFVEKLKSGEIQPINRVSNPGEERVLTEEQKIADEIVHNPIKQMLFLRWTHAEKCAENLRIRAYADQGELGHLDLIRLAEQYEQIASLLAPVFHTADYVVTEEAAHELLMQAEELVPTRRLPVVERSAEEEAAISLMGAPQESA